MPRLKTTALVFAVLVSGSAAAKPAAEFLNLALQGDRSEMTLGSLIQSHGESPKVRAFGEMLVRDHSSGHMQVSDLAKKMQIRLSDKMAPEADAELSKLRHLQGKAFDREARRYMIDDHQKDIAAFSDQVRSGDPQTSALAKQTLPVLRKHLAMAQALPS